MERRRTTLKEKVANRTETRETRLQDYADFIDSKPMQDLLVDQEFGLHTSFDQVCRLGFKQGAVTHNAWMAYAK